MSVSYIVGLSLSSCTFCKSLCKYSQWLDSCAQAGDILSVIKNRKKKKKFKPYWESKYKLNNPGKQRYDCTAYRNEGPAE